MTQLLSSTNTTTSSLLLASTWQTTLDCQLLDSSRSLLASQATSTVIKYSNNKRLSSEVYRKRRRFQLPDSPFQLEYSSSLISLAPRPIEGAKSNGNNNIDILNKPCIIPKQNRHWKLEENQLSSSIRVTVFFSRVPLPQKESIFYLSCQSKIISSIVYKQLQA